MRDQPGQPPFGRRPSRTGADTPRSGNLVQPGGKVDPDAVLKRIQLASRALEAPSEEEGSPALLLAADADDRVAAAPAAGDDAPNRVIFVLQRDLQKRLDKYLSDRIPFMSRTQLQRLIDEGGVLVNGRPPKSSTRIGLNGPGGTGDRVEVFLPPPPSSEVQPEDIPLNVLYEDAFIIVLNKQPDIIVHPARSHNSGTMINALAYHFRHRSAAAGGSLSNVGKEFARPGVVHRLDRHTSGLIVFAKDDASHWRLARQFELRTVDKRYLALVHGLVEPPVEVIDKPLGPHPSKEKGYREKYVVRHDVLGKASVTICRVRAHYSAEGSPPAAGYSLVELELKTGRTHQIRVHLSHTGYPIVADDMYGGRPLTRSALGLSPGGEEPIIARQALHAATLSFRHPETHAPMSFAAPLTADMLSALAALRELDPGARRIDPPGATIPLNDLLPDPPSHPVL